MAVLSTSCWSQYFEGTITYDVEVKYKGQNERHKQYYENEKFGDQVIVSVNEQGFVKKEFPNSSRFGVDFYLYDPIKNIQYSTYRFTDTVFWYYADTNIVANYRIYKSSNVEDKFYEGKKLESIHTTGMDEYQNLPLKASYYYDPNRANFNYKSWKNNRDFLQGELYNHSKSMFLFIYSDYGNYEYTWRAKEVKSIDLDNSSFSIPVNSPLKQQ